MSMDRDDLKAALSEVLQERRSIDAEEHRLHHEFVAELVERRRASKERWEKVRTHVYGWGAVSAISGGVYFLGEAVKQFFINLFKIKGGP